ncbi:MAG: ribonuclease HII [Alphaproteobacteria bacterium]|nr:ribonuclease HII [Alphaproteobacteria bacterium]
MKAKAAICADFSIEDQYDGLVCGLDEVGRGPLAGPVIAACVVIPKELRNLDFIAYVKDSKKLSAKKRDMLYDEITAHFPYEISALSPQEIDEHNILQASLSAMKKSHDAMLENYNIKVVHALIDGNKVPIIATPASAIIKGDAKSKTIAAASIIAKVTRDKIMSDLAKDYPYYGWERNAGYPTKEHRKALLMHGITSHHRRSFAPVRKILESSQ